MQSQPGSHFDEAVESESYECDAASNRSSSDRNPAFDGITTNGEVLQSPPTLHDGHAT